MSSRLAVVLFNLGGPDTQAAVEPFLFNLFNDPAIIGAPTPVRWLLAKVLSRRRAKVAREIYAKLGGGSPLLPLTRDQASALQSELAERGRETRTFVCMRYWHPMSEAVAAEVRAYAPQQIVLLPLYPQFSTTTTGSSLADWQGAAQRAGLAAATVRVCCYPLQAGFIAATAGRVRDALASAALSVPARILFSAHGLPKRVIAGGDPYQWQVEQTCAAVVAALGGDPDHRICYQSRVGPLEWIGPSIDVALAEAAADKVAVVVVPIAFVSEHSETLVELDIEYRERAAHLGIPAYIRVPAHGTAAEFITGLADLVEEAASRPAGDLLACGRCPASMRGCPWIALSSVTPN